MRKPHLFFSALIVSAFLMPLAAMPASADHGDGTLYIANDSRDINYPYADWPYYAKAWGEFEKRGLDVDFVSSSTVAYECAVLDSGSAHFGTHAYPPIKSCPDDVVAIAATSSGVNYHIYVKKGTLNGEGNPVESIADLGGLKLVAYGCGTDGVGLSARQLYDMLQEVEDGPEFVCPIPSDGLGPKQVGIVTSGPQSAHFHAQMAINGTEGIVGGIVSTKASRILHNTGAFDLIAGPEDFNVGERRVPVALLTTSRAFLEAHPGIAEKVVEAYRATRERFEDDKPAAMEIMENLYPEFTEDDWGYFYDRMIANTPRDLCMDPEEVKRAGRFYALKSKEELPLDGAVQFIGCGG